MSFLETTGSWLRRRVQGAGYSVRLLLNAGRSLHYLPRRSRFTLDVMFAAGVRTFPVTMVVALFAGMILALQTGIELKKLGQDTIIGNIVALSMCREMGPFITALILAATVGSAMAAEIGTMKVSEEVTALEVMSVDPVNYLALPRILGLTIMCPVVTLFSNIIGIAGGSIVAQMHLGISPTFYWMSVQESLVSPGQLFPKDVYTGLAKAIVFGCAVSTVSCAAGLTASGGALGVGRAVQNAVKNSVILIIVLGYILTWAFYFLKVS